MSEEGCLVDCYIPNQEGALVTRNRDGIPYTIQQWYEGRECDTRSREDIPQYPYACTDSCEDADARGGILCCKPSLEDEYQRHNQELKKYVVFLPQKRSGMFFFEKLYCGYSGKLSDSRREDTYELRESDYAGLRKEAIEQGKVCPWGIQPA